MDSKRSRANAQHAGRRLTDRWSWLDFGRSSVARLRAAFRQFEPTQQLPDPRLLTSRLLEGLILTRAFGAAAVIQWIWRVGHELSCARHVPNRELDTERHCIGQRRA